MTVEHAELAPAALLNFRATDPGMETPYLTAELMARVQLMGAEEIPSAIAGETNPMGPLGVEGGASPERASRNPHKAPAWMKPQ